MPFLLRTDKIIDIFRVHIEYIAMILSSRAVRKVLALIRYRAFLQKIGLIANLANSSEPEKLINIANQIVQIAKTESISLEDLGNSVKQKVEEKQMLEEGIKQRRAMLKSTNK